MKVWFGLLLLAKVASTTQGNVFDRVLMQF